LGFLTIECDTGKVSDGYHTFDELYEHRCLLFIALTKSFPGLSWKSRLHHEGTMFPGGWFIAGMNLPSGAVSYHLPERLWDLCGGTTLATAPEWDGHTADDAAGRLKAWLEAKDFWVELAYRDSARQKTG